MDRWRFPAGILLLMAAMVAYAQATPVSYYQYFVVIFISLASLSMTICVPLLFRTLTRRQSLRFSPTFKFISWLHMILASFLAVAIFAPLKYDVSTFLYLTPRALALYFISIALLLHWISPNPTIPERILLIYGIVSFSLLYYPAFPFPSAIYVSQILLTIYALMVVSDPSLPRPRNSRLNKNYKMPQKITSAWIGVRGWQAYMVYESQTDSQELLLGSLNSAHVFRGRRQVARCSICGSPPGFNCFCGLYASFDLIGAEKYGAQIFSNSVIGAVRAGGTTVEHPGEGFRSERQEIIAILDRSTSNSVDETGKLVSNHLSVPFLKKKEFLAFMSESGSIASDQEKPDSVLLGSAK